MNRPDLAFYFHPAQRTRFYAGQLRDEWHRRYRELFDADDVRLANTQKNRHFFEWLAAVLLYESTGYLSLVEKYETHPAKKTRFADTVPNEVYEHVLANRTGLPDLFVFHPQTKDWFFCEVKGGTDRHRKHQRARALELARISGRQVVTLQLMPIK